MTTDKKATAPQGPPPDAVLLAKCEKELDDVWRDLTQAQADFAELERAGEAKDAEIAELEGVKMTLAFENQDLEAKVQALQKQLQAHKQSSLTATAALRSSYSQLKAKHNRLLEQVSQEQKAAPSSGRKRPLPVGVLVPEEKSKKLAAKPSNRPRSPKPSSSRGAYVDPEEKTKKWTAYLRG